MFQIPIEIYKLFCHQLFFNTYQKQPFFLSEKMVFTQYRSIQKMESISLITIQTFSLCISTTGTSHQLHYSKCIILRQENSEYQFECHMCMWFFTNHLCYCFLLHLRQVTGKCTGSTDGSKKSSMNLKGAAFSTVYPTYLALDLGSRSIAVRQSEADMQREAKMRD